MLQFFSKIAQIVFWVFISTLFISGTKLDNQISSTSLVENAYTIQVSGNLNIDLHGFVDYEIGNETTARGVSFSTLKLKLYDMNGSRNSIEFLVSKNTKDVFPIGNYKVSRNKEGLLNDFEGVFGFANISALGELPLFAKGGEIQIDHLDDNTVEGRLSVTMENTIGNFVRIQGNFKASKECINFFDYAN